MSESILIPNGISKAERYSDVLSQLKNIVGEETNTLAILSIVVGVVHEVFGNFWTGFYLVEKEELVLGPYHGPLPCLRIPYGKGVCGHVWETKELEIVQDVEQFPGHIACSSESKSEVVVPVFGKSGEVIAVFDIDGDRLAQFDEVDAEGISQITTWLSEKF